MILRGRCVSPGVFEGRAHGLNARAWIDAAASLPARRSPAGEIERLRAAQSRATDQLERVAQQVSESGRMGEAEIFAAHLSMMRDPTLVDRIERAIREEERSAESAIAAATSAFYSDFDSSALAMVRDKAPDVLDIGHRLLRCLDPTVAGRGLETGPLVLVGGTLTPSELVRFAQRGPCAALTETCGEKSHVAILARSLGVPLLTGLAGLAEKVPENALVLADAAQGIALVDPSAGEQREARQIRTAMARAVRRSPEPGQPRTRDGAAVSLALNISGADEAASVSRLGAVGVGLLRSEFLYMTGASWPDEAACLAAYERIAAALGDGEFHVRLADFGADKRPEYADFPVGRNPSLGARGVRLLLHRDDILGPQVRALGRLAVRRPLVVLVPMLDSVDTLRRLKRRVAELCSCSEQELPFELGAMVEVPAAALTIEEILEEVDCAAIGLNDLTQYVMAADREDESVERYHDALQPAVLRLLREVVAAADSLRKPVSVCGELAGDLALTAALLALGVRRFSVSRADYTRVAELMGRLSLEALERRRGDILSARSAREVRAILGDLQS